jgi:opacity protein-like surface antigen
MALKDMLRYLIIIFALVQTSTSVTRAQTYEITPFIGGRTSDSLEEENTGESIDVKETRSYGILLSLKKNKYTNYDFLFSRQNTELQSATSAANTAALRFDYYHLGGTVFYDHDVLNPFITGGLGATHISPGSDAFSSDTRFSLSVGGGLKFPLTPNMGLRFEVRGYGTVIDGSGTILCANGACFAKFKGSLFLQVEASAGLSIAF